MDSLFSRPERTEASLSSALASDRGMQGNVSQSSLRSVCGISLVGRTGCFQNSGSAKHCLSPCGLSGCVGGGWAGEQGSTAGGVQLFVQFN